VKAAPSIMMGGVNEATPPIGAAMVTYSNLHHVLKQVSPIASHNEDEEMHGNSRRSFRALKSVVERHA